jgi:hypothetical protein
VTATGVVWFLVLTVLGAMLLVGLTFALLPSVLTARARSGLPDVPKGDMTRNVLLVSLPLCPIAALVVVLIVRP